MCGVVGKFVFHGLGVGCLGKGRWNQRLQFRIWRLGLGLLFEI